MWSLIWTLEIQTKISHHNFFFRHSLFINTILLFGMLDINCVAISRAGNADVVYWCIVWANDWRKSCTLVWWILPLRWVFWYFHAINWLDWLQGRSIQIRRCIIHGWIQVRLHLLEQPHFSLVFQDWQFHWLLSWLRLRMMLRCFCQSWQELVRSPAF